jgi:hypothetical protein
MKVPVLAAAMIFILATIQVLTLENKNDFTKSLGYFFQIRLS